MFGAFGTPALSVEDAVHQKCLQAADYKGCIEVMSGSGSGIETLKKELKLLPSRLEANSLRDYYSSIQGFRDAVSLIDEDSLQEGEEKDFYAATKGLSAWLDVYYQAWNLSMKSAKVTLPREISRDLLY